MRTSYSLDLQQLLELLEDVCSFDLERPMQIACAADGGMELYLAPANGKCMLQIDFVSLLGAEPPTACAMPIQNPLHEVTESARSHSY